MPVLERGMNRIERILFRVALVLAGLIIAVRICAVLVIWYLRHSR